MRVKSRIPEGGAIKDYNQMTMEQYSSYMKTRLWKQYTEFAENMAAIGDCQYDLVISRESLHHWIDPGKAFREVKRVLKKDGKVCIYDHRRDLGLFGKIIVKVFSSYGVKEMMSHWRASIKASYTAEEIGEILESAGCDGWKVEKELMNLAIFKS